MLKLNEKDIEFEAEFRDTFDPVSGHTTVNTGLYTMLISNLTKNEYKQLKAKLIQGIEL